MEEVMGETSNIRRYEGRGCSVTYDAKRCIHAAECARGLPAVFDSKAKPWIRPAETEADVLAPVIERCPSGALKLERADGTSEPVPTRNTATLTRDGPTYLRGDVELVGADGTVAMIDTRMALCRCGASQNKPLCDGSHRAAGFRHPGTVLAGETPPSAPAGGRLTIRQRPNGPLMCTGPLSVVGTDGRAAYAESTFLCRCGGSANKPYCDGTHKKIGFST
jgi:CDGSH-type Zn-finger protein/uncharacterized Fe-S cluster protein YjdI